jgi:hypothetical protein
VELPDWEAAFSSSGFECGRQRELACAIEDGRAGLPVPFRRLVLVGGRDLIPFRAYHEADAVVGRCLASADDLSG